MTRARYLACLLLATATLALLLPALGGVLGLAAAVAAAPALDL